jgi:hypothetical protein
MKYGLLVRRLERLGGGYITRNELKILTGEVGLEYYNAIGYLISNKYLARIMRGIFYIKSVEERRLSKIEVNHLKALETALKIKKIRNWYFGLETAASLNNATHEYFTTTFVISDSIGRPKPFEILGHKVKFFKFSKKLFGFGTKEEDIKYSDPEKTVLDMIYLSRYNSMSETETEGRVADTLKHCSKEKLETYSKKYPKSVAKFLKKIK